MFSERSKVVLIYLTVFALVFSSVGYVLGSNEQIAVTNYSGEEIFLGLTFGQGDVGRLFPEMWSVVDLDQINSPELVEFTAKIVNQINQIDTNYFDALEKAVYSKNVSSIGHQLDEGGKLLMQAFQELDVNYAGVSADNGSGYMCVFVFIVYGAVAYGHQWVYEYEYFWGPSSVGDGSASLFEKETFIKRIIERL